MRLRLPLSLRSALLACSVLFTTVASASVSDGNLGNVMYIGDSITHGVNSGSWRWAMHKIFTDNGVSYTEKGIMTGNFSGGVAAGTSYGGKIFQNIHSPLRLPQELMKSPEERTAAITDDLTGPTSKTGWA